MSTLTVEQRDALRDLPFGAAYAGPDPKPVYGFRLFCGAPLHDRPGTCRSSASRADGRCWQHSRPTPVPSDESRRAYGRLTVNDLLGMPLRDVLTLRLVAQALIDIA